MTAACEVVIGWRNAWTVYKQEADWVTGRVDSSAAAEPPMGALFLLGFVRPRFGFSCGGGD